MSKYVLSVDADLDLDDIREYIATDSLDAADRWIAKLFEAFDALGRLLGWDTSATILQMNPFCSGRLAGTSSSTVPAPTGRSSSLL